jgi:hypothetical protein
MKRTVSMSAGRNKRSAVPALSPFRVFSVFRGPRCDSRDSARTHRGAVETRIVARGPGTRQGRFFGPSFVPQGFNRIQSSGGAGRVDTEDDADADRDSESNREAGRNHSRVHIGEHLAEL